MSRILKGLKDDRKLERQSTPQRPEPRRQDIHVPVEDVTFPDPVLLGRRAVVGSLHQLGQVEGVEARLEKAIVRELNAAIPQGEADQTGRIDD